MPYNNSPIVPSKEITGTVSLPLARVKKIIQQDEDIAQCSANAAFVITAATELFLQHLVEQSYNIVKAERKPRKNIQYRDIAHAVARVENLEFLSDVVPRTTTYKQFKQKQAQQTANAPGNGQRTLNLLSNGNGPAPVERSNDAMELDEIAPQTIPDDEQQQQQPTAG